MTSEKDAALFTSSVDKREYNQALNLYRQYKKNSTAGWLVLAGYSHINKESFSAKEPYSIAKYFLELSGVEPFSINQSTYSNIFSRKVSFDSSSPSPNYYYLKPDQIRDSLLLMQADLYIINNLAETPYENNERPQAGFRKYLFRADYIPSQNGYLIWKLYIKEEYYQNMSAIPVYIKRSAESNLNSNLRLPEDNYYLVVTDKDDRVLYEGDITRNPESKSDSDL